MAHPDDPRAERLLTVVALPLVEDIREDIDAAHRVVGHLDRCDLEAVACILAALVPVDLPVSQLAWWRPAQRADAGRAKRRLEVVRDAS